MRLSWGQTVAGGLPFPVAAGLLLLPGHLLGPDRVGELAVPATQGTVRSVQAAPPLRIHHARVAPRRSQAALASRRLPVTIVAAKPRTARVIHPAAQSASVIPVATLRRPLPATSKPTAAPSPAPTPTPAPAPSPAPAPAPTPTPTPTPTPGATPAGTSTASVPTTPAQPVRTVAAVVPARVTLVPSNEVMTETPQAADEQQVNQAGDSQGDKPQGDQGPGNHGQGNQGGGPGQGQGKQGGGPGQGAHGHGPHSGGG
jgi:hypothetical protein